ncbi:Por secretion system C-terminal sorting domain-containing protein [Nonlabens sp. Hel1_33_55]|uniref:T9SS type A sorting domain-containing protein n=1 Tax=Nonlabens sp. Hel1_33_55 TaxID=1336802 RepID=UPI000875D31E|nr:T9SS type A sorting domain-containing protein [Nonlabens sp. Hel1_33_55]SCX99949.1 Por secretion system C-terminal sorting domain-containing protein [Nonlabens sp. Hel1_33_55]
MKQFLLSVLIILPLALTAQSFEFNNSADGWSANNATLTTNANSITLTLTAGQNAQLETTTAGIDAAANSIMAIRIRNSAETSVLKVRSERLETTGNRFTPFDVEPYNFAYTTYFFDLDNSEWDNNDTPGTTQNNIVILFRGPGDTVNSTDGSVEIDRIAFIPRAEREDFTFETDGIDEGWNGQAGSDILISNGVLAWDISETTGDNPRLAQTKFSIDALNAQYVHIVLRNNTPDNQLRLNFTNSDSNNGGRNIAMDPDDGSGTPPFQVLNDQVSNNANWTGIIDVYNFVSRDNTATNNNSNKSGTIEIERIVFDNNPTLEQPYIYTATGWEPTDPSGTTVSAASNIYVRSSLTLSGDLSFQNLYGSEAATINLGANTLNAERDINIRGSLTADEGSILLSGTEQQSIKTPDFTLENLEVDNAAGAVLNANLNLDGVLTLTNGALTTQPSTTPVGVLTFKSTEGKSAVIDQVVSGSINGPVTVEQFFPASTGRAYRFVSAPVNFDGSITDNWQQGGLVEGEVGFEPNVGTQITGGPESEGYDQSVTNAPSLFTFDNSYTVAADAWQAVISDNGNDLNAISPQAGDAYRIFIRGDRTIDLTSNTDTPTDTKLKAQGTIVTGTYPATAIPLAGPDRFALVGNPYQAKISAQALLEDPENTNVVRTSFWQWDPTIEQYGLFTFEGVSTLPMGSILDGDVSPGQSFFVTSDNTGNGELRFKETYKVDAGKNNVNTKNFAVNSQLTINLSTQEQLAAGKANDVAVARFDDQFSNDFNDEDTAKFFANTHSLAWENNGEFYIVNRASQPQEGDKFNLNVFVGETADYGFTIDVPALDNINAFFYDNLDESYTALPSSESTLVMKNIDVSDDESAAADRFQVVFSKSTLGVDDESAFAKAISLYPNPVTNSNISIKGLPASNDIDLSLYNISGQLLFERTSQNSSSLQNLQLPNLSAGVYVMNITSGDNEANLKLIIQ